MRDAMMTATSAMTDGATRQAFHQSASTRLVRTSTPPARGLEFHIIYALAWVACFFAAVLERALPPALRFAAAGRERRPSVWGAARDGAGIAAGFAFMG